MYDHKTCDKPKLYQIKYKVFTYLINLLPNWI